jgi:ribosomal protein S18 acetylase RimI-like enzyme
MMATTLGVQELAAADEPSASEVLTQAFMQDPFYLFVFPEDEVRRRCTRLLWKALVRTCRLFGKVHTSVELDGAACWLAPGSDELTFARALRSGFALPLALARFPPAPRRLMLRALEVLDAERRKHMPGEFWYLEALGVAPSRQGRGIGGRLMAPVLALADAARLPCYLETETERNVTFYQKFRFRVMSRLEFPGTPVVLWTMRRDPPGR